LEKIAMRHLIVFGLSAALASAAVACGDDPVVDPTGSGGAGAQGGGGTGAGASGAGGPGGGGSGGGDSCGNGEIDAGEDCDTADLGGATCESLGFGEGTLTCTATCSFDDSQCPAAPTCGDDVINGTDACDGDDLGTATCEGEGFDGGDIACDSRCQLDTSACCEHACKDGETQCNGDAIETCSLGASGCFEWSQTEDCSTTAGNTCDATTVTCAQAGGLCSTAVDLTNATFPVQVTGTFADDPSAGGTCDTTPTNVAWFTYTAPETNTFVISGVNASTTSAWSRIAVFESDACSPYGAQVSCTTATSKSITATAAMVMGQTYLIMFYTDGDTYTMVDPTITIEPYPQGATCATAIDVTAATFPVTALGNFVDDPTTGGSCDTTPNNAVWFTYTAATTDTVSVKATNLTSASAQSRLAVFDGASCSPLGAEEACVSQTSKIAYTSFSATAGNTYLFMFYTNGNTNPMLDPELDVKIGVPLAWTCDPFDYADGAFCDCGCGVIDPDCGASPTAASCDSCESCATDQCSLFLEPADITMCNFAPGNTCTDPLPLVSGSFPWEGASNNFVTAGSTGCTGYVANGVDRVHVVTLSAGETLTVSLQPTAGDASIYLITDCADSANTCVVGSDSGNPETINYTSVSGGTYYFVADRWTTGTTTAGYTLTVTIQ
jgi:hypothetical protein